MEQENKLNLFEQIQLSLRNIVQSYLTDDGKTDELLYTEASSGG